MGAMLRGSHWYHSDQDALGGACCKLYDARPGRHMCQLSSMDSTATNGRP